MALKDIQRQAVELGRIRIGTSKPREGKGGRTYKQPIKLDAFRFTTGSQRTAHSLAAVLLRAGYKADVSPWEGQWQVVTDCRELPVTVPPGDAWGSQDYELWRDGVCDRRCDGETERLRNAPCLCPPSGPERTAAAARGRACKPTTRINLIIPEVEGIGVWRLESHGFYAAVELGGAVETLAALRGRGVMVPAILRLEHREAKRVTGRGTEEEKLEPRDYYVPVLEILTTFRDLVEIASGGAPPMAALPPTMGQVRRAIEAAPPRVDPRREPVQAPASWADEEAPLPPDELSPPREERNPAREALRRAQTAAPATPGRGLPAQPPASAEALYALALQATDIRVVDGLAAHAGKRGWTNEYVVTDPDADVAEELCEALNRLRERFVPPDGDD